MQELYLRKSEENQKRTEKGLSLLNLLFGAGILADLGQVIMIALSINEGNIIATLYHSVIAFIISAVLIATIGYYFFIQFKIKHEKVIKAVDGVIIDDEKNVVLIRRRYPPYQGFYALPGGFIESGENEKMALIREIKEETNLEVKIIKQIGKYDDPERDPRGKIESKAFLCKITGKKDAIQTSKESKEVKFVNPNELQKLKLAFDHRKIIKDSGIKK
jgi:8-oxo-dGTP diphosphatase